MILAIFFHLNLSRVQYKLNQNIEVNHLFTLQETGEGEGGSRGGAGRLAEVQPVCIFFLTIFRLADGQT